MNFFFSIDQAKNWARLLRWDKPSGRLILLIPAGWSLWLTPSAPPSVSLVLLIIAGGISISGAGCIANDLWDIQIDKKVERTKLRPLAQDVVKVSTAWGLLIVFLFISLLVVFHLPISSQDLCLKLSLIALIPILIYPSSKRWFKYPQALLSICWGFAVLIPWAAMESSLKGGSVLILCWVGTMTWTFGFDTIYAMADRHDDRKLGLKSSVISLGRNALNAVAACYFLTTSMLGISAYLAGIGLAFWPIWLLASFGMLREVLSLKGNRNESTAFRLHFRNQVLLGGLFLLGLVLGHSIQNGCYQD